MRLETWEGNKWPQHPAPFRGPGWPYFPGYRMFIYGLSEPGSALFHYVGSTNRLTFRLYSHWNSRLKSRDEKGRWLAELDERGLRPVLTILEITTKAKRWELESRWRRFLRGVGHPLTNAPDK